MKRSLFTAPLLAALPLVGMLAGCDGFEGNQPPPPDEVAVAQSTPRSAALALAEDGNTLVMVNTDDGTVGVFDVAGVPARRALLTVGALDSEPWAVVITPDSKTAFVLLRNTGAVVQISNLDSQAPTVGIPVFVGAEPTSLVLSPTGKTLFVSSFVEGSVYVLDTEGGLRLRDDGIVSVGGTPRGLCMTNDLDEDDSDELLFVTNFFSVPSGIVRNDPNLGAQTAGEGTDFGRQGLVHVLRAGDLSLVQDVALAPIDNAGFPDPNNANVFVGAFPNQLFSCTVNNGKVYVPNMAAGPRGAVKFNANVQGVVSVFEAAEPFTELRRENGEPGTVNLNDLVKLQSAPGEGREFITSPTDISFVPGTDIGYVTSAGSDIVLRTVFNADGAIEIGSPINFHIKAGQNPRGSVISPDGARLFIANRVTRDLSVISLAIQSDEVPRVASTATPDPNVDPEGFARLKGFRFFNTSFGRWSNEGWGSCEACHPDGLTDGVTWHFAAGPRQTLPLDGMFDKNNPNDQRILNWTGIFDELHDFELNTRGVSGGLGAIVDANNTALNLANAIPGENNQGLNGSAKGLNDRIGALEDWNQIEAYTKTIRPLNASRQLDRAAVERGRDLFEINKCGNCHGGPKWTISRRRYEPLFATSEGFKSSPMNAANLVNPDHNLNALHLEPEEAAFCKDLDGDPTNGAETCGSPLNILRVTCVLRDVGTFGRTLAGLNLDLEVAADMATQAQGIMGYNPPSLFSLSAGGPLFHHGQAETLEEAFDEAFADHFRANSVNFLVGANAAQQKADLIAFLLSIDANTAPVSPDNAQDLCPNLP